METSFFRFFGGQIQRESIVKNARFCTSDFAKKCGFWIRWISSPRAPLKNLRRWDSVRESSDCHCWKFLGGCGGKNFFFRSLCFYKNQNLKIHVIQIFGSSLFFQKMFKKHILRYIKICIKNPHFLTYPDDRKIVRYISIFSTIANFHDFSSILVVCVFCVFWKNGVRMTLKFFEIDASGWHDLTCI